MPDRCDDCGRTLKLEDWQTITKFNDELLRLCEECFSRRENVSGQFEK